MDEEARIATCSQTREHKVWVQSLFVREPVKEKKNEESP